VTEHSQHLSPSEAARRLGVSVKALRVYERRGLLTALRTTAGWRTYGPSEMSRATEIVALRGLGFSLAQIADVLGGDMRELAPALARHQAALESEIHRLTDRIAKTDNLRKDLARGQKPPARELVALLQPSARSGIAFDLPWPWGSERFELGEIKRLTYIVGPLGSGKTRLAQRLADMVPNAVFLALDRTTAIAAIRARLASDAALKSRADQALDWIVEDGGVVSDALLVLIAELESAGPDAFVIDMIEQGLDEATQEALIAYLRHGRRDPRPLFFLTRSSAILDLAAVGPDEAIIFCPANHSPPFYVMPYSGTPGYEAVATCLASPEVRARTEGVIAMRPASA